MRWRSESPELKSIDQEQPMSEVQQIREDLQFVRNAVARRERTDTRAPLILYLWAAYIVIGYTLMDFRIQYAGLFFGIGGMVGGILSWIIGRSYSRSSGEIDRASAFKATLPFGGGIMIACFFTIMLTMQIETLRGTRGSQVFVVMIGLVYFLWGVHYQRYFIFLGLVVMAGGGVGRTHSAYGLDNSRRCDRPRPDSSDISS